MSDNHRDIIENLYNELFDSSSITGVDILDDKFWEL